MARETHLDQLADKLDEDRVRRVVEPLLHGDDEEEFAASNLEHARDIEYVRDLGLIARQNPVRMANPIYAEVVPRELSYATQDRLVQEAACYVRPDGDLDVDKLMGAFQTFFREHSEHWLGRFDYQEAGPQLLLQGFLQRIVNGGGRIEREYGLGYGRTRPADRMAVRRHRCRRCRRDGGDQNSSRVQGAAPASRAGHDHRARPAADRTVHGPLRLAGRAPGDLRPQCRQELGREGVPA